MRFLLALLSGGISGIVWILLAAWFFAATWEDNWPIYIPFIVITVLWSGYCIYAIFFDKDDEP